MSTFRIPSLMRAAGALPARAMGADRSHQTFGDGGLTQVILDQADRLFYALTLSGYQIEGIRIQALEKSGSPDAAPVLLSFENPDHYGYSIGWFDWAAETGCPVPDPNSLTIAILVSGRTRYQGAGQTFAVALPGLGNLGPISDSVNAGLATVSVATGGSPAMVSTLQVEVASTATPALFGRQAAALGTASATVGAVIAGDLATAGANWMTSSPSDAQPGLLPIFRSSTWSYEKAWIQDMDQAVIETFGEEMSDAMSDGRIDTATLATTEMVASHTFGELWALARSLPVPPQTAVDEVVGSFQRRLATVSSWRHHPENGPLAGAEQLSYGRLLMLAHNLRVIDVLGASSVAAYESDMDSVDAVAVTADITGRYENRWNWDAALDPDDITILHAPELGCLQVNQVGRVATGWWQSRERHPNETSYWRATQHQFTAALVSDGATSAWNFTLVDSVLPAGASNTGTMTFDFGRSVPRIDIQFDDEDPTDQGATIPDGIPTRWTYELVAGEPHLSERAFESMAPAEASELRAAHRTPLHEIERIWTLEAAGVLVSNLGAWVNASQGVGKNTEAITTDDNLEAKLGRYLHADDADGVVVGIRQLLKKELAAQTVQADGRTYSAYAVAINMAYQQTSQTPVLGQLLEISRAPVSSSPTAYTYDWQVDMEGFSGDGFAGAGVMLGVITVTKSQGGSRIWQTTRGVALVEYGWSPGTSWGFLLGKDTGGTIRSNANWDEDSFEGPFDMWGVESGAFVARWGWTGGVAFHGDGVNPPLMGDANGLNVALGLYIAVLDFGAAAGYIFGAGAPPPNPASLIGPQFTPTHVTAADWMGTEAFFDEDSSAIQAGLLPQLEGMLAEHLAAFDNPHGRLLIDGHASAPDTAPHNEALSLRRAQAVAEAMKRLLGDRLRIPEEEIELVAYGESQAPGGPDGPEDPGARRVDVFMDADILIGY